MHQYPRFAGTGTCQNQQVVQISGNRLPLGVVERVDDVCNVHGPCRVEIR